ncbi:MAG: SDR family NAD(P)-dependent oxidoreductase [Pseudomonadales bacterium]|nr:SDR family NAD(P)-dependent oxidoreductase [Pseudomonadales bacterium]
MSKRLDGKVAIVTGGSSGLGKATALAFGREGACVAVAARRQAEIEATAQKINDEGGQALAVVTDVTDPKQVDNLMAATLNAWGRLDVAFNNAGVFPPEGLVHDIEDDTFDQLFDVNVRGTWLCMKAELPHMLEQGSGSIINMASSAGVSGWSDNPV